MDGPSRDRPGRPKLVVEGVSKRFTSSRASVQALEDVSLEVAEGEFVCLVGPSGCGKSTLLDIIAGLTRRTRDGCWRTASSSRDRGGSAW